MYIDYTLPYYVGCPAYRYVKNKTQEEGDLYPLVDEINPELVEKDFNCKIVMEICERYMVWGCGIYFKMLTIKTQSFTNIYFKHLVFHILKA